MPIRHVRGCALAATAAVAVAGCGSGERVNRDRPAPTINVSAAIAEGRIVVSPRAFGAGPIRLVVSNQTAAVQELTFERAGRAAGITRTTAPIRPAGTTTLELDVERGGYALTTADETVRATRVRVGAPRRSGQDRLQLP